MKGKILASFVLAMLLAAILTLYASVGTVESASFLDFNFHDPDGAFSPQDLSINSVPPPTEWNKTYGEAEADRAYHVIETSDGGYALAGYTFSYGAATHDLWMVKTDSSGNVQWNKTYGGAEADRAYHVIETSDGGYALAGCTGSFGVGNYDFWLVKTDSTGNMQWNKTYGGPNDDIAYSLVQTNDDGYAIAGNTASYGAGGYDFWLVKTDSDGNVQWNKTYGGADTDIARSVVQTDNTGYGIAGYTDSYGAGNQDFWLIKVDSSGNVQWNKTYGGPNNDSAYSLVHTEDGGYAIAGNTKSYGAGEYDLWLVKTDSTGIIQWNKTQGGTSQDIAYSAVQTSNGGFAITGDTSSYGAADYDFWLVKTDSTGNMQWNKTYGGPNNDIARSIVQTPDGGYAMAGYTASYGAGDYDFWLVKVETEAEEVHNVAVTNVAPSKTVVGQGFTLDINVTVRNLGTYSETFSVIAYANTTVIETETVTLENGNSTSITFTWNTTGFAYGNYTLSAVVDTVPGETDTADNTLADGFIIVTIPGDVDGNGHVDLDDLYYVLVTYGAETGDPDYDPNADIDNDGEIDLDDLYEVFWNYGA